ncbi:MFS transporter [Propionimicrobium sp. PCR01-08-3]|uniref:MFS transporter n=1 Tax=Propionimicrobium sp. PCR01-08-3 TaxID=3052086 RepID=UPI00255C609B|nr:MFS transporter [Propionimicrobium sp. PCR01-08-3]WIY84098.1 MFS transporter [Propionimicrobium sp. PCR01-08-3]
MATTDVQDPISMDDVPLSRFHMKLFFCSAGCPLVDGYALGIIAVALAQMQKFVELSALMSALIGMATLCGMFIGSLIGGQLTDLIGRRKMFIIDFAVITTVCIVGFFFTDPLIVFIFRILLGVAMGADYPVAGPYLTEFIPRSKRGSLVGTLNAFWYIGYAAAFVIGYFMLGIGETAWRWMLLTPGILSGVWLIERCQAPESPRWLMSKGRDADAQKILTKIGPNVVLPEHDDHDGDDKPRVRLADIFRNGSGKWVFFVAAFWSLQVLPTFGIGTYVPIIMESMGFAEGNMQYLGSALMNVFYLLGLVPVFFLMDTLGRRLTMIWAFAISGAALFVLAATSHLNMPFWFILVVFIIYGAFNVSMGAHQWIYPNELFPTHIRGTASGFCTAVSRIVSAVGTFLFPFVMDRFGIAATLGICGGLFMIGLVLSIIMAPETRNMNLADSTHL